MERIKLSEVTAPISVVFIGFIVVGFTGWILGLTLALALYDIVCK